MQLDAGKLAKLMVLERLHPTDFELLFHWQLEADGVPPQLEQAEKVARGQSPRHVDTDVKAWAMQPGIRDWLLLEPPLAGVALGSYYTFSRDRLKTSARAARLPAELQQLLVQLQSDVEPTRENALREAGKLEGGALSEVVPVLIEAAMDNLDGAAAKSLRALAKDDAAVAAAMFASLEKMPLRKARVNFALKMRVHSRTTRGGTPSPTAGRRTAAKRSRRPSRAVGGSRGHLLGLRRRDRRQLDAVQARGRELRQARRRRRPHRACSRSLRRRARGARAAAGGVARNAPLPAIRASAASARASLPRGLTATLEALGLGHLVGRDRFEVLDGLLDALGGDGASLEDQAVSAALIDAFETSTPRTPRRTRTSRA